MSERTCPLCQRQMKRAMSLYESPVCKKCYSGFANRRQLAFVIDIVLYRIASGIVFAAVGTLIAPWLRTMETASIAMFGVVFLGWALFCCKDGFAGMSPGKALFGVQTLDEKTLQPIGFLRSLKRNLPLFIPFMFLAIGFTLFKGKRTGDNLSNCRVVWRKYKNNPVFAGGYICRSCGYDLQQNTSGTCPECGTEFQPFAPADCRHCATHRATRSAWLRSYHGGIRESARLTRALLFDSLNWRVLRRVTPSLRRWRRRVVLSNRS